jgi:hypothetical protein
MPRAQTRGLRDGRLRGIRVTDARPVGVDLVGEEPGGRRRNTQRVYVEGGVRISD